MSDPDYHFNPKTRGLERGGVVTHLCKLHADMFACYVEAGIQGVPIGAGAIARALGFTHANDISNEIPAFLKRLKPLGITLGTSPQGSWLVFEDIPKWKPTIPDPVRLESETR